MMMIIKTGCSTAPLDLAECFSGIDRLPKNTVTNECYLFLIRSSKKKLFLSVVFLLFRLPDEIFKAFIKRNRFKVNEVAKPIMSSKAERSIDFEQIQNLHHWMQLDGDEC
jgi:hypothetical protein